MELGHKQTESITALMWFYAQANSSGAALDGDSKFMPAQFYLGRSLHGPFAVGGFTLSSYQDLFA